MKKRLIALLLAVLMLSAPVLAAEPEYSAQAMILYAPDTDTVLFEKNADAEMLIASTTKIMTALVVLEHCALDETVCPTAEQAGVEGSSMYLRVGEPYTVEELLCGLMLASGNDAALALAEHTAGSAEAFAGLMNEKCRALGLKHTHFINPHGLDAEGHYSSASDLARITAEAMKNPEFCRFFSARQMIAHGVCYTNHNKLLGSYDGCTGGKTGYTKAAGRVLVSGAERDGLRLICVTISAPDDWTDHRNAYDAAFARYRFVPLPQSAWSRMVVLSGTAEAVSLGCGVPGVLVEKTAEAVITAELPRFVFAPVCAGDQVGRVRVTVDGVQVLSAPIFAQTCAEQDPSVPLTARERLRRGWQQYCKYSRYEVYPVIF